MLINLQRATREALHYSVLPTEQLQVPEVRKGIMITPSIERDLKTSSDFIINKL